MMNQNSFQYVYGPVLSRRLGRSLGVDLVPFKTCTYDCIYCQLGCTTNKTLERKEYVAVNEILTELEQKLAADDPPDYISLAGSGEPTLNSGIGDVIKGIKKLTDIPVAVLTNGSLLWRNDVQDALMEADLVLPSLDVGDVFLFQYVNRPHRDISFMQMIGGIATFTKRFPGSVWLEVLLLAGVTGMPLEVKKIAAIAEHIGAERIHLNSAWRPCAEEFAYALPMKQLQALAKVFPGKVEIISEAEGENVASSAVGGVGEFDILGLLRRRPCTLDGIAKGLGMHVAETIKRMDFLLATGKVDTVVVGGKSFYVAADLMPEKEAGK
jgi:wyosine [tRNA(Phe)-imidazoG37] synthetase (radical SAM superfamily)